MTGQWMAKYVLEGTRNVRLPFVVVVPLTSVFCRPSQSHGSIPNDIWHDRYGRLSVVSADWRWPFWFLFWFAILDFILILGCTVERLNFRGGSISNWLDG